MAIKIENGIFPSLDDLAKNSLVTKEEIDTVEKIPLLFAAGYENGLHWNTEKGEDTLSHKLPDGYCQGETVLAKDRTT